MKLRDEVISEMALTLHETCEADQMLGPWDTYWSGQMLDVALDWLDTHAPEDASADRLLAALRT